MLSVGIKLPQGEMRARADMHTVIQPSPSVHLLPSVTSTREKTTHTSEFIYLYLPNHKHLLRSDHTKHSASAQDNDLDQGVVVWVELGSTCKEIF